jgi:hypothetical protein
MKQEVIQNFLKLPGIMGVALICGQSRPYFYGFEHLLNFQQREALAQGIRQVIETMPPDFDRFEFQFNAQLIHLHRLAHGTILIALISDLPADYPKIMTRLKSELQDNVPEAVALFRHLAGTTRLPNLAEQSKQAIESLPQNALPVPPAVPLGDLLAALNQLSQFGTQYLGAGVVANNWQAVRPNQGWLSQFQIDRKAKISFSGQIDRTTLASLEQQQQIQQWTLAFVDRCGKVIRTFPKNVRQKALNDAQQALLLPD